MCGLRYLRETGVSGACPERKECAIREKPRASILRLVTSRQSGVGAGTAAIAFLVAVSRKAWSSTYLCCIGELWIEAVAEGREERRRRRSLLKLSGHAQTFFRGLALDQYQSHTLPTPQSLAAIVVL